MNLIQTDSFKLAVYERGKQDAEKFVLCLPGRLDTKDYAHMRSHVEHYAEKGYQAVSFDPPGTWESPGGIELYSMTNYLKAITEVIAYYGNKPTVLIGHSRGGSMAMLAGSQNEHVTHFVCVMSNASESMLDEETKSRGVYISERDTPEQYEEEMITFHLPLSYFEDSKQYDILGALKTCTKPKLFFYGNEDVLVTEDNVRHTYNEASDPKEIKEVDCDHDYRNHPNKIREVESIIDVFLEKYPL